MEAFTEINNIFSQKIILNNNIKKILSQINDIMMEYTLVNNITDVNILIKKTDDFLSKEENMDLEYENGKLNEEIIKLQGENMDLVDQINNLCFEKINQ